MARLIMAWVRFAFTLPWSLVGWGWAVLCSLLFFADVRKLRFEDAGLLTTEWRPWFSKVWRYSTTIGRAKIFSPGARDVARKLDERLEKHERVHIWQVEDLMFLSFIIGLVVGVRTGDWPFAFFVWVSGGVWQVTNFVTALLRFSHNMKKPKGSRKFRKVVSYLYEIAYRDSEHERSAYAQTDVDSTGESWWDRREEARAAATGEILEDHQRPF